MINKILTISIITLTIAMTLFIGNLTNNVTGYYDQSSCNSCLWSNCSYEINGGSQSQLMQCAARNCSLYCF